MNPKLFEDARLNLPVIGTLGTQDVVISNLRNFGRGVDAITVGTATTPDGSRHFAIISWGYSDAAPYAYTPLSLFIFTRVNPRIHLETRIARCVDNLRVADKPDRLQYWYDSILTYQQVIRYGEQLGVL